MCVACRASATRRRRTVGQSVELSSNVDVAPEIKEGIMEYELGLRQTKTYFAIQASDMLTAPIAHPYKASGYTCGNSANHASSSGINCVAPVGLE